MSGETTTRWSGNGRILIVDDEPIIRDLLGRLLMSAGFDVTTVEDAAGACEKLSTSTFDVLIADLNLPGTRGGAFCLQARELQPGVRTILITGEAVDDVPRIRDEWGVEAVLFKPFDFRELLAAVGRPSGHRHEE